MRTESEMLDLILQFANEDERVRAVIMNGSRVNPTVDRDIFQDYDIVFIVSALDEFVRDRSWIKHFGELIIMQTPDENALIPCDRECFAFLMLFQDGNRIDLTLHPLEKLNEYAPESLSVSLMDKDGILGQLPPPNDGEYMIVPPTAKEFSSCCNEFWWVSTYVAKGLWRHQLPYANYMFEHPVRDMLTLMLKWYIGTQTNFSANVGACGKYFEKHLPRSLWDKYLKTFSDADYQNMWRSLFTMCDLFREVAMTVAEHFGYDYPVDDDQRVTDYLRHIRDLPSDAERIFY
jgi:aminoglycoside 6-adenylyltransferase